MRFFSLALFVCSLLTTASAFRDYGLELYLVNENAVSNVCTDAEYDDLSNRAIPTILSVMADPKYDLKPTKESDWKTYSTKPKPNRKERELQTYCCAVPYYVINGWCYGCLGRRLLRSERELSDIEVLEIRSNTEGAMRGLLNKFVNTSPYSKECTKALIGAKIVTIMTIVG